MHATTWKCCWNWPKLTELAFCVPVTGVLQNACKCMNYSYHAYFYVRSPIQITKFVSLQRKTQQRFIWIFIFKSSSNWTTSNSNFNKFIHYTVQSPHTSIIFVLPSYRFIKPITVVITSMVTLTHRNKMRTKVYIHILNFIWKCTLNFTRYLIIIHTTNRNIYYVIN